MMSVVPEPSMSASRMRFWSNWSGESNQGCVVHRDLGAETAVAEVGPVADFAIANAHEVGKPVTALVREVNRLRTFSENELRAGFFVAGLAGNFLWSKALFGERGMPAKDVIFGDK